MLLEVTVRMIEVCSPIRRGKSAPWLADGAAAWSPDGNLIAFATVGGLWLIPPTERTPNVCLETAKRSD